MMDWTATMPMAVRAQRSIMLPRNITRKPTFFSGGSSVNVSQTLAISSRMRLGSSAPDSTLETG